MNDEYRKFLGRKRREAPTVGPQIDPETLHSDLFPFQRALVTWAVRKGRAALFADTGLGKTVMQLEWARAISERTLILAPLAVASQTVEEGKRWNVPVTYARSMADAAPTGITITNYEMADRFEATAFDAVVLDESSILKNYTGAMKKALIAQWRETPYRLCCTATPAPNDTVELCNHADFLGVMTPAEMLAMFFTPKGSTQDGTGHSLQAEHKFRLKGHARDAFWRWMASWAMAVKRPSDLGFDDDGYDLPPLSIEPVYVESGWKPDDQLLFTRLRGVTDRASARKSTIAQRVAAAAELIAREPNEPWLMWCGLNDEAEALRRAIPDAVNVEGSNSRDRKEAAALWFVGKLCICDSPLFRDKLPSWRRETIPTTNEITTSPTEKRSSLLPASTSESTPTNGANTCALTTSRTPENSSEHRISKPSTTGDGEKSTPRMPSTEIGRSRLSKSGSKRTQTSDSISDSESLESPLMSTDQSSPDRAGGALSAVDQMPQTGDQPNGSMSIIATQQDESEGCSVPPATSPSGNSVTTPTESNERLCTCGHVSGRRVLISKTSIFGHGLNFQRCARMVFVGLSDSYEQYYQAIRRTWRFGQTRPVHAYLVLSDVEADVYNNVRRKEAEADEMSRELIRHVSAFERAELAPQVRRQDAYEPRLPMIVPHWIATEDAA